MYAKSKTDILTLGEISMRIRHDIGKTVSPSDIKSILQSMGYKPRREGGKIGYHKSCFTAVEQRVLSSVDKLSTHAKKASQNQNKQHSEPSYYMFNGERDNVDYDWEVDESVIRRVVSEAIERLLKIS